MVMTILQATGQKVPGAPVGGHDPELFGEAHPHGLERLGLGTAENVLERRSGWRSGARTQEKGVCDGNLV